MCGPCAQVLALSVGQFDIVFLSEDKLEARISGPAAGTTLAGDIVIPATVQRPSDGKFYTVVEVGPPYTNIRNENADWPAFYNQPEITSVTIPATVSSIWNDAFTGCTGIEAFIVDENNPDYMSVDGVLYAKSHSGKMDALVRVPAAYPAETFTIPDGSSGVMDSGSREVRYGAFRDNSTIKTLVIGEGVYLQDFALFGNRGIRRFVGSDVRSKNINGVLYDEEGTTLLHLPPAFTTAGFKVPNGVTTLADYSCTGAQMNLINLNGVTKIGKYALSDARCISSLTIPARVTEVGIYAFSGCDELQSVKIEAPLTALETGLFLNCPKLTSVEIPASCKAIYSGVFRGCSSLKTFSLANMTSLGREGYVCSRHFEASGIQAVNWPSKIVEIPEQMYFNCADLKSISLKPTTEKIRKLAFYSSGIETFNTTRLKEIEDYAFENCRSLRKIVLAESDHELHLGYQSFKVNEGTQIFVNHKNIGYNGWTDRDWSSAFYGNLDKATVYTSNLRPEIFVRKWGELYCPWGVKEHYKKFSSYGTVSEMFVLDRTAEGGPTVIPNYNWVKITAITEEGGNLRIDYTARDVKMSTVYPADFVADASTTGLIAAAVQGPLELSVTGREVIISSPTPVDYTVCDLSGRTVARGKAIDTARIPLPSPGIYIITAGPTRRKIIVK